MRRLTGMLAAGACLAAVSLATAQRPEGAARKSAAGGDLTAGMMRFDKDGDGKLTREEVTDARLRRLFDRADADKDGVVTKDELNALAAREPAGGGGFGPPGGPGGFGPPGGGRMFMPPRPGEVLSPMFPQRLNLSADPKKHGDALQKDVHAPPDESLNDQP